MTFRDARVYYTVLGITIFAALAAWVDFQLLASMQYVLLVVGTIVIGIPHGAADNGITYRLAPRVRPITFHLRYTIGVLAYGALWWLLPAVALIVFLLLTMYHFGQSNLFYAALPETAWVKKLLYLPWGAFYILPPILFQYAEAAPVVRALVGYDPVDIATVQAWAPPVTAGLLATNATILALLRLRGAITGSDLLREAVGLGALVLLYAVAPLYVAFIVYWAFWHSLNSVIEIARVFDDGTAGRPIARFYRAAVPLSLVTFAGIALIFGLSGMFRAHGDRHALIALFFGIIAALTVPHSFVMELLYRNASHARRS